MKNNGFEILVTTKNGKIALIQCIQRIITSEKLKRLGVWRMQNGNNVLLPPSLYNSPQNLDFIAKPR